MRLTHFIKPRIISTVVIILLSKIFKVRIPLVVSWALTYRCSSRCLYCALTEHARKELSTKEILHIMESLSKKGMRYVSFTGGEPLLRNDIEEIVVSAVKKGIYTSISSNGTLVKEKISLIKRVNKINLSLDGPQEIHDFLRGLGSHYKLLQAIEAALEKRIKVILSCVLSRHNLHCIDYVLSIAVRFGIKVYFQPATRHILGGSIENSVSPFERDYRQAILELIKRKKKKKDILNSVDGLKHLYYWPAPRKIPCFAGLFHFRVEPDGQLSACSRQPLGVSKNSQIIKMGMDRAIKNTPRISCSYCWCAPIVEFNLITSLRSPCVFNFLNQFWLKFDKK